MKRAMDPDQKISQALKVQLHKSLTELKLVLKFFIETKAICRPCIDRLINLTEQYQCCDKVDPTQLPNKIDFIDVKDKLMYKLSMEVTKELESLKGQL